MSDEITNKEESTPEANAMNRRDFARFTAFGAAAVTLGASANAEEHSKPTPLTFSNIVDPGHSAFVGPLCASFLKLLNKAYPGTSPANTITVEKLLYGSLKTLLTDLNNAVDSSDTELKGLFTNLINKVGIVDAKTSADLVSLADMYMYNEQKSPRPTNPNVKVRMWQDVYNAWRKTDTTKSLYTTFPLLFIDLPPIGDPSGKREAIKHLFTAKTSSGGDNRFRKIVGPFKYIDLYTKSAEQSCVDASGKFSLTGYLLVRTSFDFGVLSLRSSISKYQGHLKEKLNNGAALTPNEKHILGKNDKCWSVIEEDCVNSNDSTDYCATSGGQPTASSDFCD